MTSFSSKSQARIEALKRLDALDAVGKERGSASIRENLMRWDKFRKAGKIMMFAGLNNEPDLIPLLGWGAGRFFFPRVRGEELEVYEVKREAEFVHGAFGIREPEGEQGTSLRPEEIDLVLVPGLGFGESGERLGRGGGYYDRFLPQLRNSAEVAGVCFECQIFPALPTEDHDVRMTSVISEGVRSEFTATGHNNEV